MCVVAFVLVVCTMTNCTRIMCVGDFFGVEACCSPKWCNDAPPPPPRKANATKGNRTQYEARTEANQAKTKVAGVGLITTKEDKLQAIGTNYNSTPKTGQITTSDSLTICNCKASKSKPNTYTRPYKRTQPLSRMTGCNLSSLLSPSSWAQQAHYP